MSSAKCHSWFTWWMSIFVLKKLHGNVLYSLQELLQHLCLGHKRHSNVNWTRLPLSRRHTSLEQHTRTCQISHSKSATLASSSVHTPFAALAVRRLPAAALQSLHLLHSLTEACLAGGKWHFTLFASVTLTLTSWPSYTNFILRLWQCTCL